MENTTPYEVRYRGEFMLPGRFVNATNPKEAVPHNKNIDYVVMQNKPGLGDGDWWLITGKRLIIAKGVWDNKSSIKMIHPYHNGPNKGMLFAKTCEAKLQDHEKNSNLKLNDFNKLLKKHEQEWTKIRTYAEKKARLETIKCLKECALAEAAIITGKKTKAKDAISNANAYSLFAMMYAKESQIPGATKPNKAEVASSTTKIQLDITTKRIKEFQNITIPKKQDKILSVA